ncbi:hypothetical protein DID77_01840 [Candidatus Marinamargulisbacteria bacterium SCGC AG-439-L15]|nr:hypothetical protein DID77_01840 [Candidatus Marinamargulisbacteria bacterium SCGC AG-439-L15]
MKKLIVTLFLFSFLFVSLDAQAQKKATDLPNISVLGNFLGKTTDDEKSFDVQEIEFAFQHYLYPSVKADIFAGFHKEEDSVSFELEEAYVTFMDVYGLIVPNTTTNLGLAAIAGKKQLSFGKVNPLHFEQLDFVDRPLAIQSLLSGNEGLKGEGAELLYLLPVNIFSQLQLGYWTASSHAEEHGHAGEESHGPEYENRLMTARLWNAIELSKNEEVELGLSYLGGNASASETSEQTTLAGIDLTYSKKLAPFKALKLQAEYLEAQYADEEDASEREKQAGGYLSALYQFNKYYEGGVRYGFLGKHGDEGENKNQWSVLVSRQLTETSKFRLQYTSGEEIENVVYAQFIFGMGPHAHVLQ